MAFVLGSSACRSWDEGVTIVESNYKNCEKCYVITKIYGPSSVSIRVMMKNYSPYNALEDRSKIARSVTMKSNERGRDYDYNLGK